MKRIPTSEFPNERVELVLMIRWLLNEIEYTHSCLVENNINEAKETLRKEIEDNMWLKLGTKKSWNKSFILLDLKNMC